MPGISPAHRARRRTEAFTERLPLAKTPKARIAVAYDHLRAAIAVSSEEAISTEADIIVTQLADSAARLMAWRIAKERA